MNRLLGSLGVSLGLAGLGAWGGLCGVVAAAATPAPVAVVEQLRGKVAGVEFMDYVTAGQVIVLGPKDSIVLGYLRSCWRETITGGTVTVGDERSAVRSGQLERRRVECDGGRARLGAREATQSAVTVFRSMRPDPRAPQLPPVTLHGRSPLIDVGPRRGTLVFERIDQPGERFEIELAGQALLRGRFIDLAGIGIELTPGASYALGLGALAVEVDVAADAKPGPTPVIGRLLRFE